jgi:hypothetical protein
MTIRRGDAIALAIVLLGVILVGIVVAQAPQKDDYVDTYSTRDADVGGYMAWYRLLEREHVRVTRFDEHPDVLPNDVATLVVENDGDFYERDVPAVRRFVARGGTLVWISSGADEADKAWKAMRFPRFTDVPAASVGGPQATLFPDPALAGVHALALEKHTRLTTDAFPPAVPLFGDRGGAIVARYRIGRGTIVIVTDPTIFTNRALASRDDARLALSIVPAGGRVAFDEQIHGFGTTKTVWQVFPAPLRWAIVLGCIVAFLAWIGANLRIAPLAVPALPPEANASSYIASLATLLRRGRAASRAAHDLASSTFAACARSLGIAGTVDEARLVAAYRTRGDVASADAVREIARLRDQPIVEENALVRLAALCLTLRKETRHGRAR